MSYTGKIYLKYTGQISKKNLATITAIFEHQLINRS